jgi:hypothetical protein
MAVSVKAPFAARRVGGMLIVVLLILAAVALQSYHFHDRNYRQDEINTVHAAQVKSLPEIAQWMASAGVHPAGWRMVAAAWVQLTGVEEPIARYSSTLCMMITLALVFRLGCDLFDEQVGLLAVVVLGTLPFAMFYLHEFRPYPMLALWAAGMQLAFLRWLRRPLFRYALLYVGLGMAALQTHYFGAYIVMAHAVVLILLVRWDRGLYLRAFGLFAAIGLSLIAWLLPLLQRVLLFGGRGYARPSTFETLKGLYRQMQIAPLALGQFLFPFSLLIPARTLYQARQPERFRFGAEWRKLYLVVFVIANIGAAFIGNQVANSVTARNLITILPSLAVLIAYGLRRLPWQAGVVMALLLGVYAVHNFRVYLPSAPYRQVAAFISPRFEPGDRIVLHINGDSDTQKMMYYLLDHLPITKDQIMHLYGVFPPVQADPVTHWLRDNGLADRQQFKAFLGDAPRVWYIRYNALPAVEPFVDILKTAYAPERSASFAADKTIYQATLYRRIPEDAHNLVQFGDAVSLQAWNLPGGVDIRACAALTLETWWLARDTPPSNYGIGVVIADATGMGIIKSDALPSSLPTLQWEPNRTYMDVRTLRLPCDTPPGDYPLLIGVHDRASFEPLPTSHPESPDIFYLTTLHVSAQN